MSWVVYTAMPYCESISIRWWSLLKVGSRLVTVTYLGKGFGPRENRVLLHEDRWCFADSATRTLHLNLEKVLVPPGGIECKARRWEQNPSLNRSKSHQLIKEVVETRIIWYLKQTYAKFQLQMIELRDSGGYCWQRAASDQVLVLRKPLKMISDKHNNGQE